MNNLWELFSHNLILMAAVVTVLISSGITGMADYLFFPVKWNFVEKIRLGVAVNFILSLHVGYWVYKEIIPTEDYENHLALVGILSLVSPAVYWIVLRIVQWKWPGIVPTKIE